MIAYGAMIAHATSATVRRGAYCSRASGSLSWCLLLPGRRHQRWSCCRGLIGYSDPVHRLIRSDALTNKIHDLAGLKL